MLRGLLVLLSLDRQWERCIIILVVALRREAELHVAELADGAQVRARAVFVAAGPWTSEKLLGAAGRQLLSLSRGIHIVLKSADLPLRQPVVVQAVKVQAVHQPAQVQQVQVQAVHAQAVQAQAVKTAAVNVQAQGGGSGGGLFSRLRGGGGTNVKVKVR